MLLLSKGLSPHQLTRLLRSVLMLDFNSLRVVSFYPQAENSISLEQVPS